MASAAKKRAAQAAAAIAEAEAVMVVTSAAAALARSCIMSASHAARPEEALPPPLGWQQLESAAEKRAAEAASAMAEAVAVMVVVSAVAGVAGWCIMAASHAGTIATIACPKSFFRCVLWRLRIQHALRNYFLLEVRRNLPPSKCWKRVGVPFLGCVCDAFFYFLSVSRLSSDVVCASLLAVPCFI